MQNNSKKYKIFGINVVDLLAVLVVVAAVVFLGVKFAGIGKSNDAIKYEITYSLDELSTFVADHLAEGCRLYDDTEDIDLGRCLGFETAPSVTYGANASGEFVRSSRDGYVSLKLSGEVFGTPDENGVKIGGHRYCIGDFIVLRAGDAKVYISIYDIKEVK